MTDHYETLGVTRSAHPDDIRRAYRRAASLYHPDRPTGGDADKMTACNVAYAVLMDRAKRAAYDATLSGTALVPVTSNVSRADYEEAKSLAPWLVRGACGFCDGAKQVRVGGSGFWYTEACPVCAREGS